MNMRPSQLAHRISHIIAEASGCPAAWDRNSCGELIEQITDAQLQRIRLQVIDLLWPEAKSSNPVGAAVPCSIPGCDDQADFIQNGRAFCTGHSRPRVCKTLA